MSIRRPVGFRRSYDLQLSAEVGRSKEDHVTQVAIERRQTVCADVRMRQSLARLHVRGEIAAGTQSQTVRLHGSVSIHIHHLKTTRDRSFPHHVESLMRQIVNRTRRIILNVPNSYVTRSMMVYFGQP